MPVVKFRRLENGEGLPLPCYAHPGDSGMDLRAAEDCTVRPASVLVVPTGFSISLPDGYEGQVRSRSGLASKGIFVANQPGTIDSGYIGEVKVLLSSLHRFYWFKRGERIAQLVIAPVAKATIFEVAELSETERGYGGFGSTGTK